MVPSCCIACPWVWYGEVVGYLTLPNPQDILRYYEKEGHQRPFGSMAWTMQQTCPVLGWVFSEEAS